MPLSNGPILPPPRSLWRCRALPPQRNLVALHSAAVIPNPVAPCANGGEGSAFGLRCPTRGGPGLTRPVATRIRAGETRGCPTFRGLKRGVFGPAVQFPEVNDWAGVPPWIQDGFACAPSFRLERWGLLGGWPGLTRPVATRMRAGETGGCPTFRGLKRGAFGPQFNSPRSTTGRVPHLGDKTVSRVPHPSGLESWATDARVPHVSRFETWGFRTRSSIPRGQRLGGRPILTTKRFRGCGPKVQLFQVNARNRLPEAPYLFRKKKRNCSTPNLLGLSPVPESPDCGACTPVSRAFSWRSRR